MSRHITLRAIALSGAVILAAVPYSAAHAVSGDALANAERTCLDHKVQPGTNIFDVCVSRAAAAFDRGQATVADDEARRVSKTRGVCLSYGLKPQTLGYQQCINNELDRHAVHNIRYIDNFGFRYDASGNLYDPDGYRVQPNPRAMRW